MFMFKKKLEMPSAADAMPGRSTPIPTAREHFVLHRSLKGPYPAGLETAMFGMGCFWGAERVFWQLPGVTVTAVGYAGGPTPNPTYREVCSGRTGHGGPAIKLPFRHWPRYQKRTTSPSRMGRRILSLSPKQGLLWRSAGHGDLRSIPQ